MQYQLVVKNGPDSGKKFELRPGQSLTIGRGATSDTQINDPRMSRMHCEVRFDGPAVVVQDLGSSSGTLVDGEAVESKCLAIGQCVQAGDTELELQVAVSGIDAATMASKSTSDPSGLAKLVGNSFGKYSLQSVLAPARSGLLFRSYDDEKQRTVAVKVLMPSFAANDEQRERFVRAMKTMLPIRHDNIVRLYNAGKTGEYCWVAMQFVDGENLSQIIDRIGVAGMLDWRDVWRMGMQVARGLSHAHSQQIIHRNVTPTNILRRREDKVCLLGDLMLAKALEGTLAQQVTQPGQLLGELPYQSPERTHVGTDVDARSDLYELGATMYALLTGQPPAAGKSIVEIIKQVRSTVPKRPKDCQMSINENFSDLVMKLLEKDPDRRYESAEALIGDLERVGSFNGLSA